MKCVHNNVCKWRLDFLSSFWIIVDMNKEKEFIEKIGSFVNEFCTFCKHKKVAPDTKDSA